MHLANNAPPVAAGKVHGLSSRLVASPWRWIAMLALAGVVVSLVMLGIDVATGAINGWNRWRLDDGSLLSISSGADFHQATLRSKGGVTTVSFKASERIGHAECRTDGQGNYWLVTRDGDQSSVPVYVTAAPHDLFAPGLGPGRAPAQFTPTNGYVVPAAWLSIVKP